MHIYRNFLSDRTYLKSIGVGLLFLSISLILNFYTGTYAAGKASNYVTDIILDNIPAVDVDGLFVWGPFVLWAFVIYLCAREPQKIPFLLKNIALFTFIRSIFISITHIGPSPDQIPITTGLLMINSFTFGADLFFSGHTGLPFLLGLMFYKNKKLRILFMSSALFFGVVVLLAHLHYSIDVLSAFFITYTIYNIGLRFFKKDAELFDQDSSAFK
jgi:hypothetical protein